ncbi:MAG: nuoG [Thermomicrobiales bacterium]|nr:nuoG [Thermomicrobiales bacterium]
MATIIVDQKSYEVDERQNLLAACLSLGFNLPYFCWHPAMGSVGACRQCAVKHYKDEQDNQGRLIMACMTPASDGTRISIADPDANAFRASVIEWLMLNHPHDCPVCDEGGECHLQDMTYLTGHAYRRYRFPKRTYENQYLGPFIKHDMNRCIQCYRCVRFYRDYAGGRDLNVFSSHDTVYFGRMEDGVLENEFSGNLVEVCPTGVFNDNTLFHHYARKWDLQSAQSICPHCSVGCNTTPGERYGTLRRIVNRYNSQVNRYFLCDRGRFGYGYVNDESRIRRPLLRAAAGKPARPEGQPQAIAYSAGLLEQAHGVIGIGSPRASLEANMALRSLVGAEHFYPGFLEREQRLLNAVLAVLREGPVPSASLKEAEESDAVFIVGEDVLNTAPRLALALLQAVRQQPMEAADLLKIPRWDDAAVRNVIQGRKGPLFIAGHRRTWLDDYATERCAAVPDDSARIAFAAAHLVDKDAPVPADLSASHGGFASRVAAALVQGKRPLIVAGISAGSVATIEAASNLARALHRQGKPARLSFILPESNSLGLAMMGGSSLERAFQRVTSRAADTAIVLENDLYRRAGDAVVTRFLSGLRGLIVLDSLSTRTTDHALAVLPAAAVYESDGTFVNYEGRAQRYYQVFVPEGDVGASWRWLREVARALRKADRSADERLVAPDWPASWRNFDDAVAATARALPAFARITEAAPPSGLRLIGQKVPRQPERFSGRTAMQAHLTVHEPPPPPDPDTPMTFSMEGYRGATVPSPLLSQISEPGWHSNQALNKYQEEIGGPLRDEWPGVRLIEPAASTSGSWFDQMPGPFEPDPLRWLLLPAAHIFGSDELSRRSAVIEERMPSPFLAVSPGDAARLRIEPGSHVELSLEDTVHQVEIQVDADMPPGAAAVFVPSPDPAARPRWIDLRAAIRPARRAA